LQSRDPEKLCQENEQKNVQVYIVRNLPELLQVNGFTLDSSVLGVLTSLVVYCQV